MVVIEHEVRAGGTDMGSISMWAEKNHPANVPSAKQSAASGVRPETHISKEDAAKIRRDFENAVISGQKKLGEGSEGEKGFKENKGKKGGEVSGGRFMLADEGDYDFDVSGIKEENARVMADIKSRAVADGTFMKAPNGKKTNLSERNWLAVRTAKFKKWFGDWEMANKLQMIEDLAAVGIKSHNLTDEQLLETYKGIGAVKNKLDGREVSFVNSTYDKIIYHRGIDVKKIVPQLADIFENSVPILSEKEVRKEGHKEHNNFTGYNHYLGKINIGGKEYYVRFTAQELKPSIKSGEKVGKSQLHNTAISEIAIYEKSGQSVTTALSTAATTTSPAFVDAKLRQFFETARAARENSSKVMDKNGEPLVVYHGKRTNSKFSVYKSGMNFFSDNLPTAEMFATENSHTLIINGESLPVDKREADDIAQMIEPYYPDDVYDYNDFWVDAKEEQRDEIKDYLERYLDYTGDIESFEIKKPTEPVYSVFLNIRKPGIADYEGKTWGEDDATIIERDAEKEKDADGFIARNLREGGLLAEINGEAPPVQTTYISYNPNQIKSATDNNGDYDNSDKDIRYSLGNSERGDSQRGDSESGDSGDRDSKRDKGFKGNKGNKGKKGFEGGEESVGSEGDSGGVRYSLEEGDLELYDEYDPSGLAPDPRGRILTKASEALDRLLAGRKSRIREAYFEAFEPVRALQEVYEQFNKEKIADENNFMMRYSAIPGKMAAEFDVFYKERMEPLIAAASACVQKSGRPMRDLEDYLIFVHGMERNEHKWQQANINRQSFGGKGRPWSDYSGLKGILLSRGTPANHIRQMWQVNSLAQKYIDAYESTITPELKAELWSAINKATDFSLETLQRGGIEKKETLDELRKIYPHYIPLRGYEQGENARDKWDYASINTRIFHADPLPTAEGRTRRADSPLAFRECIFHMLILLVLWLRFPCC